MPRTYHSLVGETTNTAGTGGVMTLLGARTGLRAFSTAYTVGSTQVPYSRWDSAGNFENGEGTLTNSTTLTRTAVLSSSNANAAVNWPVGGTQNLDVALIPDAFLDRFNAFSEFTSAQKGSARTNLGLDTAATVNAARFGLMTGQSGGTVGKFVRLSGANTWVDATAADTIESLGRIAFNATEGVYQPGSTVTGFAGLTADQHYWLDVSGGAGAGVTYGGVTVNFRTTPPSTSSSQRRLWLGYASSTTRFNFRESLVVGG